MFEFQQHRIKPFYIPPRMEEDILRYIKEGIKPGEFLGAVIKNDLKSAVWHADDENMGNLPAYVAFFYNFAPGGCWGSKKNYEEWKGFPEFKTDKFGC